MSYIIPDNLRKIMINKLKKQNNTEIAIIIEESVFNFFGKWIKKYPKTVKLKNSLCRNLYTSKMRQIYHFFKKNSYIKYNNEELLKNKEKLKLLEREEDNISTPTKLL